MRVSLLAVLAVLGSGAAAQWEDPVLPDPSGSYDWHIAAEKFGLGLKNRQKLAEQKVLMTNEAFRQVFVAYKADYNSEDERCPVFITSDSILNAFHVLLEESMLGLELANAHRLTVQLKALHLALEVLDVRCPGGSDLAAAARQRAHLVLGVALRLFGDELASIDAGIQPLVRAEVERIREAQGLHRPTWLKRGRGSLIAIDYGRFEPLGIYTRSGALSRYFRAVRWLQVIPFRIDVEEELLAILILGKCLHLAGDAGLQNQVRFWREFIGQQDDPDLLAAAGLKGLSIRGRRPRLILGRTRLQEIQKTLRERFGRGTGPLVNDQIRFPVEEPGFRFLSACRTPDAVLFQRTTDLKRFPKRTVPTGLEVCAALGSDHAAAFLEERDREKVLETIALTRPLFAGSTLYESYLQCLSVLLDEPDPRAPAFMRADPGGRKNLQTVLAGWAQFRHTCTLQAKATVRVLGGAARLAGFVEPAPEFFARLRQIVARTRGIVARAGVYRVHHRDLARQMRRVVGWLRACGFATKGWPACLKLKRDQYLQVVEVYDLTVWTCDFWRQDREAQIRGLESLAAAIEKGDRSNEIARSWMFEERKVDLQPRWQRLEGLCARLERLARKQLSGGTFDPKESKEILAYGADLAAVMGYDGSLILFPQDDAPLITDVYTDTSRLPARRHLEVGVARPRALYVLYPWRNGEVLCRGAVLPYYEFTHSKRLGDFAWHQLLDTAERPAQPAWIRPLVGGRGLKKPHWKKEDR